MRLLIDDLSLVVGTRTLMANVSLDIASGDTLAVLGPSGAGKSTLLASIAGSHPSATGSIRFVEGDVPVGCIPTIDWMIQSTPLFINRSVLDNAGAGMLVRRGSIDTDAVLAAIRAVGLEHAMHTPTARLSGGERQRLAVARTLVSGADVVLADEPTASLDPDSRQHVIAGLQALADAGVMVIVATHDPVVADACVRQLRIGEMAERR